MTTVTNILTCKVWAIEDASGMAIAAHAPDRPKGYGTIIARIPRVGSYDMQRILADDIAFSMNRRRGHEYP